MKAGRKITLVTKFKVLKKYTIKLLSLSSFEIDKWTVNYFPEEGFWAMDREKFNSYFPHVFSLLFYKKLFSPENETLTIEEYRKYLSSETFYKYLKSPLFYFHNYIIFSKGHGQWNRGEMARAFHAIEELEKSLKKLKFKFELTEEKE